MPSLGPLEIVVIAVVALLVFGPNRLPEVGRQVGRAMRELRKFQDSVRDELQGVMGSMDSTPATDGWEPPTVPPVVGPTSTSVGASVPSPRPAPAARPGGAQAPSRFRAAAPPTPAPPAVPAPAVTPEPSGRSTGVPAPSRFRAPKR